MTGRHKKVLDKICDEVFVRGEPVTQYHVDQVSIMLAVMPIEEMRAFVKQWHKNAYPLQKDYYNSNHMMQTLYRVFDTMIEYRESRRGRVMDTKAKAKIARRQIDKYIVLHQFAIGGARANGATRETFKTIAESTSAKICSLLTELNLTVMDLVDLLIKWRDIEEEHGISRAAMEYKYVIRMVAGQKNVRWNGVFDWKDHYK